MNRIRAAWRAFRNPPKAQHDIRVVVDADHAIRRQQRRRGQPPTA